LIQVKTCFLAWPCAHASPWPPIDRDQGEFSRRARHLGGGRPNIALWGKTLVMAPGAKTPVEAQLGPGAFFSASKRPALAAATAALGSHASILRTRRGQALALESCRGETAFVVRIGVLALQVTLPPSARQVVALLFPGDVLRSSFAPPYAEATLVSAAPGEVWRVRFAAIETLAAGDPTIMRYLDDAMADQMARQVIHAATLGQFDCEQRVATLLVELALRTGRSSPGGVVFELPFSRKDIADYLGLNPDTLSRIMSRLKAAGLISQSERNRAVVRDFGSLAARSPAARALIAINNSRRLEAR
jgi:CRP/FNR family transcriptional regulator